VTAAVTIFVGVLIGMPAMFQGRTERLAAELHGTGARSSGGVHAARFRSGLVVAQMSLAVVLLLGSGLLVRSIERLSQVDPGFDPRNVLTFGISLPQDKYPDLARQSAYFAALSERIGALPGVQAVGGVSFLPLQNGDAATGFTVIGRPEPAPGTGPSASVRTVEAGYFATMRIPLLRGRMISAADRENTQKVVLITDALARKIWPGEDPVGQHIKVHYAKPDDILEVVGVVGDVHHAGLDADVRETIYYPATQYNYGSLNITLRTAGAPQALIPAVRAVVHDLDANIPAEDLATMSHWVTRSMADRRDPMFLLTIFAALAVTIAAVGVYAVLSFGVSQRTREIGVRMALGAQPRAVLALVLGGGLRLTLAGVALGTLAGMLGARAIEKLLFQVTPGDPIVLTGVAALLVVIALLAMYFPARRAARVDPVVALRTE
jgi:predicted permease